MAVAGQVEALVCTLPGVLAVESRRAPSRGEGEVIVRPLCIGICGTDYHIFEGSHPFLNYPRVMGHELAVEIVEAARGSDARVGEMFAVNPYLSCGNCIACRSGKPNCCVSISVLGVHQDGGMTSLFSLPERNLVRAEGLSPEECATVEFLAIGAHAVRRGSIKNTDRVLVIGAGPIGLGVALFAGLMGSRVAMMDIEQLRLEAAQNMLGVDLIEGGTRAKSAVHDATAGEGFDVVLDATGNALSMTAGFDLVAPGGRYVLVSVVKEEIAFSDPDFHRKELTLLGSRNANQADFEWVIEAVRAGKVPVNSLITHRTSLKGAVRNIPLWAEQKTGLIKALIVPEPIPD